jgi:acyl-CoA reductase-like NAD-dependent aldehyde dehydrogenase
VSKPLIARSPFSGEVVAELPRDDSAALERKLKGAVQAQREWRRVPVEERAARVGQALGWFRDHGERVAREITHQMGKPIAQSRGELDGMAQRWEHMVAIAPEVLAPDVLPKEGFTRRIEHAPLGVVLNLSAWNYPLLISVNVVVPALLAGNAVLLKHSARTPLCGRHFEEAFAGVGPPGLFASLVLSHSDTAGLIADPRVSHVAFTGSVEGGRAVHRAAAGRCVDVGLELGGKDPAYVAADADLDRAVEGVVDGACYNAGQSCCAVERVYVHDSVHTDFLARARVAMERYVLGDPLDEATTMGPLAQVSQVAFLQGQVDDAVARGARVLLGGAPEDPRFYPPTLLDGCPNDSEVMQEESFGPLLPVLAVRGDDEAIARMNETRFGLTASVWTRDSELAERVAREHDTGTVYMNRCDCLDPALPWTGVGDSGRGSTLSRYGLLSLTRRKAIHFRR